MCSRELCASRPVTSYVVFLCYRQLELENHTEYTSQENDSGRTDTKYTSRFLVSLANASPHTHSVLCGQIVSQTPKCTPDLGSLALAQVSEGSCLCLKSTGNSFCRKCDTRAFSRPPLCWRVMSHKLHTLQLMPLLQYSLAHPLFLKLTSESF